MSTYDFTNYKSYLDETLGERGRKSEFCRAIKCHPSFLSQVLKGAPHLSMEQGILASEFLEHSDLESSYFMVLLQYARAGSKKLEDFYMEQIQKMRTQRQKIASIVRRDRDLQEAEKLTYYSSWTYAFAHVLLSLSSNDQIGLVADKLRLSRKDAEALLRFLIEAGLVTEKNERFTVTSNRIHLGNDSPAVLQHHRNFRTRTLFELETRKPDSIHFSSVICLSARDAEKLKSLILKFIADQEEILKPSPEETARCLCIDYYAV
jgi:uncharacterized protein (TIGR02147 family)